MRYFIVLVLFATSATVYAQSRPFDNSKAILPWIYNPAANLSDELQAYVGYDGRGNGNFMPQSLVAGLRMPVQGGKRFRNKGPASMMGVQLLSTSQDLIKSSTIHASFAHEIPINRQTRIAMGLGAGIFNMRYNYDALVYMDQQDPILLNSQDVFNMHLNAGVSLVMEDKFLVQLATPYIIKDNHLNIGEVILRAGYYIPLNVDLMLIASANLETFNRDMIYGGDVRFEWRKMVSFVAGADRYKYHGGILLDIKPFALGYTYGMNYRDAFDHIPSHQLSIFTRIATRR